MKTNKKVKTVLAEGDVPIKNMKRRNLVDTFKAALELPISKLPKIRIKNLDSNSEFCIGVTSICQLSLFSYGDDPTVGFFLDTGDLLSNNWIITTAKDEVVESSVSETVVNE